MPKQQVPKVNRGSSPRSHSDSLSKAHIPKFTGLRMKGLTLGRLVIRWQCRNSHNKQQIPQPARAPVVKKVSKGIRDTNLPSPLSSDCIETRQRLPGMRSGSQSNMDVRPRALPSIDTSSSATSAASARSSAKIDSAAPLSSILLYPILQQYPATVARLPMCALFSARSPSLLFLRLSLC